MDYLIAFTEVFQTDRDSGRTFGKLRSLGCGSGKGSRGDVGLLKLIF